MSKSNACETDMLKWIFQNVDPSWCKTGGTGGITSIFVSLHIANPDEAGSQTTSESAYAGYTRIAVARTTAGWTESNGVLTNAAAINFPQCTGASSQVTYFAVGELTSGAGKIFYSGALSQGGLSVSNGVTPSFALGQLQITED